MDRIADLRLCCNVAVPCVLVNARRSAPDVVQAEVAQATGEVDHQGFHPRHEPFKNDPLAELPELEHAAWRLQRARVLFGSANNNQKSN